MESCWCEGSASFTFNSFFFSYFCFSPYTHSFPCVGLFTTLLQRIFSFYPVYHIKNAFSQLFLTVYFTHLYNFNSVWRSLTMSISLVLSWPAVCACCFWALAARFRVSRSTLACCLCLVIVSFRRSISDLWRSAARSRFWTTTRKQ